MLNLKNLPHFSFFLKKSAFSLIESLMVLVVIGILVTFAMPMYINARKGAIDKEAQTQLKLIQAAEDSYRLEIGNYIACADTTACNLTLRIDLPQGNWAYSVGSVSASGYTATATGTNGTQNWSIDQDDAEAS